MNPTYFLAAIIALQVGAVASYALRNNYPDALLYVCAAVSNTAILWRTA